jgi:riboflavin synthase
MFTGLVEHVGTIESVELYDAGARAESAAARSDQIGARIRVHAGPLIDGLAKSGSIAVNGCCLTAVDIEKDAFAADLSGETLRRTSLGQMQPGTRVNLERPLTAMKELGRLDPEGANWWFGVRVPEELARYIAMKGSIALDGISLTVAGLRNGVVDTAIIPFTYDHTNLSSLKTGDAVNIECDILAKYVERLAQTQKEAPSSRLTIARLVEEGF